MKEKANFQKRLLTLVSSKVGSSEPSFWVSIIYLNQQIMTLLKQTYLKYTTTPLRKQFKKVETQTPMRASLVGWWAL